MQLIVLGMHRSGTSVVARLLNMMGAYFSPEKEIVPPTTANPKGYWERWDILCLQEDLLKKGLGITWDNINQFKTSDITPEIQAEFEPKAREIVLGLDAHRPWMMKDPRFCLLLPFWRPLLEIPVCVYVHRSPVQVAQSLKKREDFSMMLGVALWEKYTLQGLANIADIPRILVSHEELMSNPIAAVKKLYQDLLDCEVQGLRLPSEKEIRAFIEPKYFHEHGDTCLQNAYINHQQAILFEAFENASIFQLEPLPTLSEGAAEILQAYQERFEIAQETSRLQEALETREQEIVERDTEIAKRNTEIAERDGEIAERDTKVAYRDSEIAWRDKELTNLRQALHTQEENRLRYLAQVASYQNQLLVAENQANWLNQEISQHEHQKQALQTELQNQITDIQHALNEKEQVISALQQNRHKLLHWISALDEDIKAVFNSLTWRAGNIFTQILLKLMFRKSGLTAQEHIQEIMANVTAWKVQEQMAEPPTPLNPTPPPQTDLPTPPPQASKNYSHWIKKYDTLTSEQVGKIQQRLKKWDDLPFISVVMPTYNTEEKWLRAAIESVLNQIYPNWELSIADDASTQPHVRRILEEYAARDQRIKVTFRTENGHISAASNTAIERVSGEFIALLDHDDVLAAHALFCVAQEIINTPDGMIWYSDEDKINEEGERFAPYFKSDWNLDLFLSHNMISHLGVYRTSKIREIGGFRLGYEGSQDYDLALRIIEKIEPEQIRHIPRVLYHWRALSSSTASRSEAKPYAIGAAQKAISEYLARQNIEARVTDAPEAPGMTRVQYPLPEHPPLVSFIIPTYNSFNLLRCCVDSLLNKTDYPHFEILIIDNASDDRITLAYLKQLKENNQARIIDHPYPFNYAEINNVAVEQAEGELICLLNNDIEVINQDWLTEMVSHILRPKVGIVGARLWYPNDTLQHGGVIVGLGGIAGHAHRLIPRGNPGYFGRGVLLQNLSAVTAACLLMRKEQFLAVGGLNAENLSIAFNDVDLCLKIIEAGLQIVWTPYAELYHHESASRGSDDTPEKAHRFQQEINYMENHWPHRLVNDPAYNPNLTLDATVAPFTLAWPPSVPSII
ncbi:MAG TPA: glycosyltransferase [Thiotrichaceae bacterium]|nr:glycosyltransferase [Thiotrichaceae bacterium]